jgi:hypothetical protein
MDYQSPQSEAIANADAHLNNAGLPTYSELLAALQTIADEAGPNMGNDDGPGRVNKMARTARLMLVRAGSKA